MEPALRSFLDGIDADDSVVALRPGAKNDNEEPLLDGSGMLDMREMAKRYREMVNSPVQKKVVEAVPLIDMTAVRGNVLAPIVETAAPTRGAGLLTAVIACGAALLVGLTVIITILVMRGTTDSQVSTQVATAPPAQLSGVAPELVVLDEDAFAPLASEESAADEPEELQAIEEEPAAAEEPAPIVEPARAQSAARSSDVDTTRSNSDREARLLARVAAQESAIPAPTPEATQPIAPPPAPAPAPVLAAAAGSSCDEVLCLLEGRSCCDQPGDKAPNSAEPSPETTLPENLTRADINAGLKPVQGRLHSCGSRHEVSGAVTIKLQISADGSVTSAKVASGAEAFQTCVADILHKAQFAETRAGTTLSYPIILR